MNIQSRVEKLEQQSGGTDHCPVCDSPVRDTEKNYDENIWCVVRSVVSNFDCHRCGRPRQIVCQVLGRREEALVL